MTISKPAQMFAIPFVSIVVVLGATLPAAGDDSSESLPEGWYAKVDTSLGSFTAELLVEQAPQTVAHFAAFAEGRMEWVDAVTGKKRKEPYYDGILVHKISKGERFEAGDHTGTGRGYPLIYVPLELGPKDFTLPYRMGMTRSGGGKINGALFFVTRTNQSFLNGRFPCFGEVVRGRETVDAICSILVDREDRPSEPIEIHSIRIHSVGNPPPLPEPVPFTPTLKKFGPRTP